MNAFDLTGKNILITGASSGLGRQAAITCSRHGANVFLTGRNRKRLEETRKLMDGENHSIIAADLTNDTEIEGLVFVVPKLNGVVYSVGITSIVPAGFIDREKIEETFKANYESVVLLNERLFRMKKLERDNCSLVWLSSISTQYPFVGGGLYVSTKAAIEGYSRVFAVEAAKKGIRSNCLRPGYIKTPMTNATEELSSEVVGKIEEKQPLGLGTPEDVANTIVFFLSDASRWITGTNLIMGGG
jgi:NAD(P)-dependent dehydrogenase (short-subunit alcohol dehydrogenase family)